MRYCAAFTGHVQRYRRVMAIFSVACPAVLNEGEQARASASYTVVPSVALELVGSYRKRGH